MIGDYFAQLERKYGLPAGYLAATRKIESNGNDNAVSPTGATGPFQFTKGTAKDMGLPLDRRTDLLASADAAARLAARNKAFLAKRLGTEPTGGHLYLAHQQGAGGAANLLMNLNAPAGSVTNPRNIAVNSGDPNAPAADLVNKFLAKYERASGAPSQGPGIGPTKEAAAMQPFMAGGTSNAAQAPAQDPTKGKLFGSDAVLKPGGGLIGLMNSEGGLTADKFKTFMGGGEVAAAGKGLAMLAQGLGGGSQPAPPPPPPEMIEDNRPDLSLLEMIKPKRKKIGMV